MGTMGTKSLLNSDIKVKTDFERIRLQNEYDNLNKKYDEEIRVIQQQDSLGYSKGAKEARLRAEKFLSERDSIKIILADRFKKIQNSGSKTKEVYLSFYTIFLPFHVGEHILSYIIDYIFAIICDLILGCSITALITIWPNLDLGILLNIEGKNLLQIFTKFSKDKTPPKNNEKNNSSEDIHKASEFFNKSETPRRMSQKTIEGIHAIRDCHLENPSGTNKRIAKEAVKRLNFKRRPFSEGYVSGIRKLIREGKLETILENEGI